MKSKITILIDEGNLVYCPSAIIEVRHPYLCGGVAARNGWHVPPKYCLPRSADRETTLYGKTVEILKKKIDSLFPESRYDREYI